MKKKYILSLFIITCLPLYSKNKNSCDQCKCNHTSISYLSVRPHFESYSPERVAGFRIDRLHAREDGIHGAAQAVVYGSQSTNDCDLARYFFPFCKTSLVVEESIVIEDKDLLAQHFNIFTVDRADPDLAFRSTICIAPQQSVVGLGLQYKQSFLRNEDNDRGFWASIAFPIEHVRNKVNFKEDVIRDGGGPDETADTNVVANMCQAFQQNEWCFGKICPQALTKTRLASIELKFGYEFIDRDFQVYLGFIAPTGNKPDPAYIFSPVVGNGQHWGVIFGGSGNFEIWTNQSQESYVYMEYAANSQYLFRNTQCRSLDLWCKPWSRYIQLYANKKQAEEALALMPIDADLSANLATPGINILTLPVKVTPGFSHNVNAALVGTHRGFQAETGYNLYCRTAECVSLACPFPTGVNAPAIKHIDGDGQTNPFRNMQGNDIIEDIDTDISLEFYEKNALKETDLDLLSATAPCIITHTIYGAFGYRWDTIEFPTFLNTGASYEFANNNNAVVKRWTVWGKVGVSF